MLGLLNVCIIAEISLQLSAKNYRNQLMHNTVIASQRWHVFQNMYFMVIAVSIE